MLKAPVAWCDAEVRPGSERLCGSHCVSYNGLPLAETSKALLTVMARARNTDQTWREDRKALTSWGRSPVLVDNVPVTVSLPVSGARRVYALVQK